MTACSAQVTSVEASDEPESRVDTLIVSVEDVRNIANNEALAAHSHSDLRTPPPTDTDAPGPCRAAGISDFTFGTGWLEFRSAGYHDVTDDMSPGLPAMIETVSQAVAVYPDASMARGLLHQLESSLRECAGLRDPSYEFTLDKPDASTVRLSADGWSHVYREKSAVLMSVGVLGLEPAEEIANTVLQIITDRVED
ncbi:sensor domain-containing protein [Mycobacterium spongiae]